MVEVNIAKLILYDRPQRLQLTIELGLMSTGLLKQILHRVSRRSKMRASEKVLLEHEFGSYYVFCLISKCLREFAVPDTICTPSSYC